MRILLGLRSVPRHHVYGAFRIILRFQCGRGPLRCNRPSNATLPIISNWVLPAIASRELTEGSNIQTERIVNLCASWAILHCTAGIAGVPRCSVHLSRVAHYIDREALLEGLHLPFDFWYPPVLKPRMWKTNMMSTL